MQKLRIRTPLSYRNRAVLYIFRRVLCIDLDRMIRVTAMMISRIPIARLGVKGSLNTNTPTHTAVIGSTAPNTAVSVPPIPSYLLYGGDIGDDGRNDRQQDQIGKGYPSGIGCMP